ncbi:hypothetical protein BJ741DRAFT_648070 [Chytriomyces cf. hyalinus JEL632]|nr:hypothetical protein BJ741DRAFT_648070 [Chytriomyces cf. hyalinus JEL632]
MFNLKQVCRSASLHIEDFSRYSHEGKDLLYNGLSLLVCGRQWSVFVRPNPLLPRHGINVYVSISAERAGVPEAEFLAWLSQNKVHFTVSISEPEPASFFAKFSSHDHCSNGWFDFPLQVPAAQSLKLTNDTLTICIEFDDGPTPVLERSATAQTSVSVPNPNSQALYPLFPAAHYDPAMGNVFDNAAFSDFAFIADGKPIHVQKHFIAAKVSAWKLPPDVRQDSPLNAGSPQHEQQPACTIHPFECIPNTSYTALHSFLAFLYSGQLPLLESKETASDARLLGQVCILAESFGAEQKLLRVCLRRFDSLIAAENAVDMLLMFGHESDCLQEIIAFVICEQFGAVRETSAFQSLISTFEGPGNREEQCVKSKRLLAVLRRLKTTAAVTDDGETWDSSEKDALSAPAVMGPVHSVAIRQLLSTPSVSDVRFVVEGKVVYGQKCLLSSLSDFFRSMFSGAWSEGGVEDQDGVSVVRVDDFPHATFLAMLTYLYVSELDPRASLTELGLLYICADKYQITDLSALVLSRISQQMSPETISHFLFGYAYQYDVLISLAQEYFVRNFNLVRKSTEFVRVVRSYWEYEDAIRSGIWTQILMQFTAWNFETMTVLPEESGGVDDLLHPFGDADILDSAETLANTPIVTDDRLDKSVCEGADVSTDSVSAMDKCAVPDSGTVPSGTLADELDAIEDLAL